MSKRIAFLLMTCVATGTLLSGCHSRNDDDTSDARFDDVGEQHVYDDRPKQQEKHKITLKAEKAAVAEERNRHQMIGEMSIDE